MELPAVDSDILTWKVGLCLDDDHREGAPHLVEAADVPGDRLLDFLHGVCFDSSNYIIDAVYDINFAHVGDLPELLEEIFLST
jgi:hypothetical protein